MLSIVLKVKGLTIRYPESTTLALACAADKLAYEAVKAKDRRKANRYMEARTRFLKEGLGATSVIPV